MRLTVGETTQEQPFEIVPDPRSKTAPEDFAAQFAMEQRIVAKLGETNKGIMRLREAREELDRWEKRAKDNADLAQIPEAVKAIKEKLQAIEDELIQHRAKSMQDTLNFPVKLNAKLASLAGWSPAAMASRRRPRRRSTRRSGHGWTGSWSCWRTFWAKTWWRSTRWSGVCGCLR